MFKFVKVFLKTIFINQLIIKYMILSFNFELLKKIDLIKIIKKLNFSKQNCEINIFF